jgi:hypothetical protein
MVAALLLLYGGYGLSTVATRYWHFVVLWGFVVGAGSGMAATVLGAAVANKWFTARRGLVMGVLTASMATGQLIFLPAKRALDLLFEAVRVRDFWLLAGSFFVCGASTNGLIGKHRIPAAFDCGIPEVRAAGLLAMMGLFDLVGTTASGWLSDRFNCRYLLFGYFGLRGLSLLFLPQALLGPALGLDVFAVFYGLDWIATVPPAVRLTGEVFGREKASIVFGWVVASH